MSDLAYIDSYFKSELTPEEIVIFEQRIQNDPAFAETVAFYFGVMGEMKSRSAGEKKKEFRKIYDENKFHNNEVKIAHVRRLWPYIAVAAVVAGIIFGWYMYLKPSSLPYLADEYIKEHFRVEMGVKMDGEKDSLDKAMKLYNEHKLPEALEQFEKIIQSNKNADIPIKMAGIVSLQLGEYDKAVDYFTQLEYLTFYSNPGKLYHAIALIKRNRPGDKEMAKQLLKQVIDQDLEGKETAQKWLKSF